MPCGDSELGRSGIRMRRRAVGILEGNWHRILDTRRWALGPDIEHLALFFVHCRHWALWTEHWAPCNGRLTLSTRHWALTAATGYTFQHLDEKSTAI